MKINKILSMLFAVSVSFFIVSCASGPKVSHLNLFPNSEIPINGLPMTWEFKGGTIYIITKQEIQIRRVENRGKKYFSGIRKGFNNEEDTQYFTQVQCPLDLLISYGSGSWSKVEMDEKTTIFIENGNIGVRGEIDLNKAKSYYKASDETFDNALLIHDAIYKENSCYSHTAGENEKAVLKGHYKTIKKNDYYLIKASEKSDKEFNIFMNGNWILFCSRDES